MLRAFLFCLFAATLAHADDAWKSYSHPDPEFSVDYPSAWTATLADKVPDEKWGDLALTGRAKVTFKVTLELDVLQIAVSVLGLGKETTDEVLLAALRARARAEGRAEDKVAFEDSPGLLRIRDEFQKAGRTIVRTHILDGTDVYGAELSVPDSWIEQCRAGYEHVVDSLLVSLQSKIAQPELPSAEQFASELVAIIDATERLDNAEMVRLFDEGNDLIRRGLAQGRRSLFQLAALKFRAMLDIDPNIGIGHFALGLSHFYAWEMGWASDEFREAVRLDARLEPLCPLLWWDDFRELPEDRVVDAYASDWNWHVRQDSVLCYRGGEDKGLVARLCHASSPWKATDTRTLVRCRFIGGGNRLGLFARYGNGSVYTTIDLPTDVVWIRTEGHDGQPNTPIANAELDRLASPGWHTAEFVAVGHTLETYLDGARLASGTVADLWEGTGAVSLSGQGDIMVDWVLVTRYRGPGL